ncbi:MAG: type VI secretion system protein TssA [Candidatus Binataceae bacterium]
MDPYIEKMSAEIIDVEALLAPISEANPAGESLRYSGTYDQIQEARRSEDDLNQGDWKHDIKVADWRRVASLASEALSDKSKDLQIVAWLSEALAKLHGFAGARDGFLLMLGLHARFWDACFPQSEDGDFEERAGALEWLNDKLPPALLELSLTMPAASGEAYSYLRYQESRAVDELGRKNQDLMKAALAEGKIAGEQFDKAVTASSRNFYESLSADLNESLNAAERLAVIVDEKFGREAPSLMRIKKVLEDCRDVVGPIVRKKRELEPDMPTPATATPASNGALTTSVAPAIAPAGATVITTAAMMPLDPSDRADALRRLEAVAAYFQRTEPQSPVSYLVQRAVRWGQMPLEQWLTDVISDQGVLAHIRETLGLNKPE